MRTDKVKHNRKEREPETDCDCHLSEGTTHAPAKVRYIKPRTAVGAPRWIVCHDYKNGAVVHHERDYVFQWWHLIDTYISFSHERITCPPPALVRCAHRHNVAILGTLIFEWDEGHQDLIAMLDNCEITPEGLSDGSGMLQTLVDLAVERGFDGWLVNVEVAARDVAQAELLVQWLAQLGREIKKKIPHAQILWYDALTVENKVEWQNKLNKQNERYCRKADGIFLNYFWKPEDLDSTAHELSKIGSHRNEAYFGVDVWGRGQYGGGGFDSWISLDFIHERVLPHPTSNGWPVNDEPNGLSTALFAPAWTVESDHLGHDLKTQDGFLKWLADEMYLWAGGPPTKNVAKERQRRDHERRREREVVHVRRLAAALATPSYQWKSLNPPPFDRHASLPPLPGVFKPMSSYRTPRAPAMSTGCFFTNFGIGSGTGYAFEGHHSDPKRDGSQMAGWTDPDLCFPGPGLAYAARPEGVVVALTEKRPWLGSQGLDLIIDEKPLHKKGELYVPLCPVEVKIEAGQDFFARFIWAEERSSSPPAHLLSFAIEFRNADGEKGQLTVFDLSTTPLEGECAGSSPSRWFETKANLTLPLPHKLGTIESIGVKIAPNPDRNSEGAKTTHPTITIGTIQLCPLAKVHKRGMSRKMENANLVLLKEKDSSYLRWDTLSNEERSRSPGPDQFLWTSVWLVPASTQDKRAEKRFSTLLGITTATEFEISNDLELGEGSMLLLQSLMTDGTLEDWAEECAVIGCEDIAYS